MITVEKSDPFSSESYRLIEMLSAELAAITGDSGKTNFTVEAMNNDKAVWALAKNTHGDAIGCGAIRPLTQNIAELKRMFSDRSEPGVGSALLTFLETSAKQMGYRELKLETRHINHRAVSFYEKNGYVRIENYGPYIGREEAVCFSKHCTDCIYRTELPLLAHSGRYQSYRLLIASINSGPWFFTLPTARDTGCQEKWSADRAPSAIISSASFPPRSCRIHSRAASGARTSGRRS